MKKYITIGLLLFSSLIYSQGEANNWFFGHGAGLKFNHLNGSVTTISSGSIQMDTEEGCSVFSDAAGNLLFYSDGNKVWNANHNVMPGGFDLAGNSSSTQSAMIIPKPSSTTEYYIFTVGAFFDNDVPGFNYYTIDMSQNGGLGEVVSGPINLSGVRSGNWSEKVAAVKGADCNSVWVISYDGFNLKSYKVDASGVDATPIVSNASAPYDGTDSRGYLKVSPDGKKIALAHFTSRDTNSGDLPDNPGGNGSVYLFDFNDATGIASNGLRIFDDALNTTHPYGLEFSRQSTKLYVSTVTDRVTEAGSMINSVYQYDLLNTDIVSSELLIHSQDGYRGAMQLGPDGKIYVTVPVSYWVGTNYLDVINAPDELGLDSNYQEDTIHLGTGMATQGLPPFISSIFSPIEITGDDGSGNSIVLNGQFIDLCLGDSLNIHPEPLSGTATYTWTFNGTIVSTNENLSLPGIQMANIGDYNLEVTLVNTCGVTSYRNGNFSINSVNPPPTASPVATQVICDDTYIGTYAFDFNSLFSTIVLGGQDPVIFEVKYFDSQVNADANTNELPTPFNSPNITIYARVQNKKNNNCFETTNFDVNVSQSALPIDSASIANLSYCDNTSNGTDTDGFILFDLSQRKTTILNGQSDSEFTLTYFTASDYNATSEITNPTNFVNTVPGGQTIYVRMTNMLENGCYADTSFNIDVFSLPVIQESMDFQNCDEDGISDGFAEFNLEEANAYITYGDTSYTVTYHLDFTDADTGSNAINSTSFNNATASTVYARVETVDGCHRVSTIDLQVATTSFQKRYNYTIEVCDNDAINDGLYLFDLTQATQDMISQFPTGQNLSVHYFRSSNEALLEQNEILQQNAYMSEIPYNQSIYVRVESNDNGACYAVGQYLTIIVHPRPEFEVIPEALVCLNFPPITLEAFNALDTYTYVWTDESNTIISTETTAEVSIGGIYTVVATSDLDCQSFPRTITVSESTIATIDQDDVTITDDSANNIVSINNENSNLGVGDYEFSLDEEYGPYQDEPYFERVIPGIHTLYIRDKNDCGMAFLEIAVIGFPKFFTPNNDGENDTWEILGVSEDFYSKSFIYIFDRFGKILTEIGPKESGWDGYYNGTEAPSDDYWFSAQLTNKDGVIKNRKGHFSLVRK